MRRLLFAMIWMVAPVLAWAEPRVALVVGNADYSAIGALDNPVNDARLIRDSLIDVGFEVIYVTDADRASFQQAIVQFGRALRQDPETVGLFYYAGHGVQSFGTNYLLPVDTEITDQADLSLFGIEAEAVLRQMYTARNKINIVILDACRDNPFVSVPTFTDAGLAEMKAPTGTYLAYATAPGQTAVDGMGRNSPFSAALSRELKRPGRAIESVFKAVRRSVLSETDGMQTPWDTSSLTVDFQFASVRAPSPEEAQEQQLWNSVSASGDPVRLMLFLRAFPDGKFADIARARLSDALQQQSDTPAPTEPERSLPNMVTFYGAVTDPASPLVGRSLAELVNEAPLHSPVEGLPDSVWQDKSCRTCHQWNQARLCDQGNFYLSQNATRNLAKLHPFGGAFKTRVKDWAEAGCQ